MPYLVHEKPGAFDINLEAHIESEKGGKAVLSKSNLKYMVIILFPFLSPFPFLSLFLSFSPIKKPQLISFLFFFFIFFYFIFFLFFFFRSL